MNAPLPPIHPADEYALYQSWGHGRRNWRPTTSRAANSPGPARLVIKALREGKERSDWNDPDHEYEGRALSFLQKPYAGPPLVVV